MKILYFGPITPEGKPSIGGYEAANRKNIDALRKRDIEVVEFANPVIPKRFGKLGKLAYLKLYTQTFKLLKYRKAKNVVLHITPLYRNLARPSLFTEWVAQKLNIPVLLDIRAGSFIDIYEHNGKHQRKLLDGLLRYANRITVEGRSYIKFLRHVAHYDGDIYYFPNLVDCNGLTFHHRVEEKINLFYFGRITRAKGVDIMLDTIKMLSDRYHLYLAGGIAPDVDRETLNNPKITYLGLLTQAQLRQEMRHMHIFFFPTRHPGEGQSNSLIEAMSQGLIPVTSDQGFCSEVVADCGKVLPKESKASQYKHAIETIANDDMASLGEKCIEHIRQCHNVDIEIPKLIKIYKSL